MRIFGLRWMCGLVLFLAALSFQPCDAAQGPQPTFHVLAFYSEKVEHDHIDFAHDAIRFFEEAARRDHFDFTATTDWSQLSSETLKKYAVILWLNDQPHDAAQRTAFENYMDHGGGWLGFHVSAYNDAGTQWAWFLRFLGGGVFYGNNWPPLPATLHVDDGKHAVTAGIPTSFIAPSNEWYIWKPSPRLNPEVKVLVTLSPDNYPIGLKDTIQGGDTPVVWTNTRYRMLYMNMGHGDKIFTSDIQNRMFENAILWLGNLHPNASR